MHTHYRWSQEDVTTPEDAIGFINEEDISHAVVMGKPGNLALKLKAIAPDRVIAFYVPIIIRTIGTYGNEKKVLLQKQKWR